MTQNVPAKLYKYRGFNGQTLDCLIGDQLFYADPNTFNDPLDSKPCVRPDMNANALATLPGRRDSSSSWLAF